jgi:hypothetical protein
LIVAHVNRRDDDLTFSRVETMMDSILQKAMRKRDEALHEMEFWEAWIKGYTELHGLDADSLDIPMKRSAPSPSKQLHETTKAARAEPLSVEQSEVSTSVETKNSTGAWPFRGKAKPRNDDDLDPIPSFLASAKSK